MNRKDYLLTSRHILDVFKQRLANDEVTHIDDIGNLVLSARLLATIDREYLSIKNLRKQLKRHVEGLQVMIASYECCSQDYDPSNDTNELVRILDANNYRHNIRNLPADPTDLKIELNSKVEALANLVPMRQNRE